MRNTELVSVETSLQVQQKKRKGIDLKILGYSGAAFGLIVCGGNAYKRNGAVWFVFFDA